MRRQERQLGRRGALRSDIVEVVGGIFWGVLVFWRFNGRLSNNCFNASFWMASGGELAEMEMEGASLAEDRMRLKCMM